VKVNRADELKYAMQVDKDLLLKLLDDREVQLLKFLIKGMNTSEIAKYLSMSYHETAEINRSLKQKLNITSINQLENIDL
jgi:FixJ family two-component response regulator